MFDPLSMNAPYDGALQFLHNLEIYKTCTGTDEMLDLVREIQFSGNYYWQGTVFPRTDLTTIPAQATLNGSVNIPAGSYVTGIQAYGDPIANPAGYKIKIYDKGTKASIFYGDYCFYNIVSSDMQVQSNPDDSVNSPIFGQNYLMEPFIITSPGVLGWEIVNLDLSPAVIQLMLCCAVPINKRTVGQVVVKKG